MNKSRTTRRSKTAAVGALAVGTLVVVGVQSPPTANATCASFFGIGNSANCSSTLTSVAIAFGDNAEAHADGLIGAAITLGNSSTASTAAGGLFNLAITLNSNNSTFAGGALSVALVGDSVNTSAVAGNGPITDGNLANVAVGFTSPGTTTVVARGVGNLAVDFVGSGNIGNIDHVSVGTITTNFVGVGANLKNVGVLNAVSNVLGDNITITTDHLGGGAVGSVAFNVLGEDNKVETSGTLALAGSIAQTNGTVTQDGFGININGVGAGRRAVKKASAAASGLAGPGQSASAGDSGGVIKPAAGHSKVKRDRQ